MIDEINRGNLSKIFGELLMLIEGDKRGAAWSVPLTYSPSSQQHFYVPPKLFLLGMMNIFFASSFAKLAHSGLLGPLERRDRAAEQKQRLGHTPLRSLETPLVRVAGLGEQGTDILIAARGSNSFR